MKKIIQNPIVDVVLTFIIAYLLMNGVEGSILAITLYIIVCIGLYYFGRKKGELETNIWNDK